MNLPNFYFLKEDLLPLMQKHRTSPIVVFDLETNGLNSRSSVLSCSALKLRYQGDTGSSGNTVPDLISGPLREIDAFERYYFSLEPENLSAIRINGLSVNVITEKRAGHDWPPYFRDDRAFESFCLDADLIVAHNIEFDIQFVPFLADRDLFCTMKSNTIRKYPKLSELAAAFRIDVDLNKLHQSAYDTALTALVFEHMVRKILPDLSQGELF